MEFCNERSPERSNGLMEQLFQTYFTEARDVSRHDELIAVAKSVGLDETSVREVLASDRYRSEVLLGDERAKRSLRVSGVPYFIIQSANTSKKRPFAFSGAQPADIIAEQLMEAAEST